MMTVITNICGYSALAIMVFVFVVIPAYIVAMTIRDMIFQPKSKTGGK